MQSMILLLKMNVENIEKRTNIFILLSVLLAQKKKKIKTTTKRIINDFRSVF